MSKAILAGLLPELAAKAREHERRANSMGIDIVFTSGFREPKEQMDLYAKGRTLTEAGLWVVFDPHLVVTNAMPAQAPHCRRSAYDLVPIVKERAAWDRIDLFAMLGKIGRELGLVWGGDWPRLKDMPHYETSTWRALPWNP